MLKREAIRVEDGAGESRNDHATQMPAGTEDTLPASQMRTRRASLQSQSPMADMDKCLSGRYLRSPQQAEEDLSSWIAAPGRNLKDMTSFPVSSQALDQQVLEAGALPARMKSGRHMHGAAYLRANQ